MKFTLKRKVLPSKRSHLLLRWSRDVFLVVGVLILGYCGYVLLDEKLYQAYETRHFQHEMKDQRPPLTSGGRVHNLSFHPATRGTLGQIEIPRIGVAAMIMEGTDNRTLRRAVGHIPGTAMPGRQGNVGIAGHRDTFFRALRNIRNGDEITLMTIDGSYRYRVDSIQVTGPENTQVLDSSADDILTLVTCYPFYFVGPSPKRFIVRAQEISH